MRAVILSAVIFAFSFIVSNQFYASEEREQALSNLEKYNEYVNDINDSPRSYNTRLKFAYKLLEDGEPNLAKQQFGQAINLKEDDPSSLGPFARLSFDAGEFELAYNAYQKYILLAPDDRQAKVEFGLAAIQIGLIEQSLKIFESLLDTDPKSFQAKLGYALALFLAGDKAKLEVQLQEARALSPGEEGMSQIAVLEEKLKTISTSQPIEEFFARHIIIGPKITRTAKEKSTFYVFVNDFPMSAMPDFAKAKFEQSVKEAIDNDGSISSVKIVDEASNQELATLGKDSIT